MKYTIPSTQISKASLLFAIGMLSVNAVQAQQAPAEEAEEIVITGMRAALDKAIDVKQNSDHVMDALSLDDINSTPSTTIAEALVRLPGVVGARDRGNESQAAIRGLGPRMVFSTLNGREVATSEPGRAVRYEQYPSEMMSAVEVYKTQSADMIEGGIAGTINLKTLSPLNHKGPEVIIRAGIQNNDGGKEIPDYSTIGNRYSASFVHQFSDVFAASFGVSSQKQKNGFESMQTGNWNQGVGQNAYDPATKQGFTSHGMNLDGNGSFGYVPWDFQAEVKEEISQRTGAVATFEFQPNDDLNIKYDILYTSVELDEDGPATAYEIGGGSWNGANAGIYTNVIIDQDIAVAGTHPWANVNHAISNYFQDSTGLTQGLSFKYTGIDGLEIDGDLGLSRAARDNFYNGVTFQQWSQKVSWDFRDGKTSVTVPDGSSSLHPEAAGALDGFAWQAHEGNHLSDNLYNAKLDFKKFIEAGDLTSVDFGVRGSEREKENFKYVLATTPTLPASPSVIPAGYFKSFSVDGFPATPFLYAPNYNDLATKMFGKVDTVTEEDTSNYWNVEESNAAVYVKANLKGDIAGFDYNANIGVRHVQISTDSTGYIPDLTTPLLDANGNVVHEWEAGPTWEAGPAIYPNKTLATASIDYKYTLPSATINIDLDETKKLRVAVARAISRPPLDELKSGSFLSLQQGGASGDAGNPYLKPYTSDQVDVSYEWYFASESLAAVSIFYKDIENYIGQSTIGTFVAPASPGHQQATYTINGPINGQGGYVRGVELTFQMPFTFLPIEGFGIYTNYSHADSNIKEFTPANNPYPMAGLASHTGVLDLWYSAHGFDARLGWKYTSAYTSAFTWNGGDLTTLDAETNLGFSLSYEFNEHFSSRIQVNNLTNQEARLTKFNTNGALARNDYYGRSALFDITWKL